MYDASPQDRAQALRAASADQVTAYLADLERALGAAGRGPDEDDTPDTRASMVEYAARLGRMQAEAEVYGGVAHAGVA